MQKFGKKTIKKDLRRSDRLFQKLGRKPSPWNLPYHPKLRKGRVRAEQTKESTMKGTSDNKKNDIHPLYPISGIPNHPPMFPTVLCLSLSPLTLGPSHQTTNAQRLDIRALPFHFIYASCLAAVIHPLTRTIQSLICPTRPDAQTPREIVFPRAGEIKEIPPPTHGKNGLESGQ